MIRIPVKTIQDSVGELLQVAPEPSEQREVQERFGIIDTIFTADEAWATGAMDDVGSS